MATHDSAGWLAPSTATYDRRLVYGFLLGITDAPFAVGVGVSSRWFPAGAAGDGAWHYSPCRT